MPFAYTHYRLGKIVARQLSVSFSPLLELGCQGGDFAFFLPSVRSLTRRTNVGKLLHGEPFSFFYRLGRRCREMSGLLPYAIGYLTHYAADVSFHRYVEKRKGELSHAAIERAIDGYFIGKDGAGKYSVPFFSVGERERRELALFFADYTNGAIDGRNLARSFALLNRFSSACGGEKFRSSPESAEPEICEEIFRRSVLFSSRIFIDFYAFVRGCEPLKRELFVRDFSGKIF